jgi:hypothetical protein
MRGTSRALGPNGRRRPHHLFLREMARTSGVRLRGQPSEHLVGCLREQCCKREFSLAYSET